MAKRAKQVEEFEEVEEAPESSGGGLETGLIFATTMALIAGVVMGLMELGKHYATGPFAP